MNRIMPSKINVGDSYEIEIFLPSPPDGQTWTRADVSLRRIRDTEVTILAEHTETLTDDMAQVDITAATTTTMADGAYRYRVWLTSSGSAARTIEQGVVEVVDPLDPARNYEERMVDCIRSVIETRMTQSGDVSSYYIGDRRIDMMSMDELRRLLAEFEEKLNVQRARGRRYFYKRRIC